MCGRRAHINQKSPLEQMNKLTLHDARLLLGMAGTVSLTKVKLVRLGKSVQLTGHVRPKYVGLTARPRARVHHALAGKSCISDLGRKIQGWIIMHRKQIIIIAFRSEGTFPPQTSTPRSHFELTLRTWLQTDYRVFINPYKTHSH